MQKEVKTKLVVKPYTNKQLAPLFNRSPRQWRREMAKIRMKLGPRPDNSHWWSIEQVIKIFEHFGRPYEIIDYTTIETPELKLRVTTDLPEEIKKAG